MKAASRDEQKGHVVREKKWTRGWDGSSSRFHLPGIMSAGHIAGYTIKTSPPAGREAKANTIYKM